MVAHEFLSQLDKLHFVDSTGLDDFADRCTSQLSFLLLVICFTIVSLKSYVFEPLSCYSATTFSGSNLMSYINAFCWANGTVAGDVETTRLDDDSYWNELEKNKISKSNKYHRSIYRLTTSRDAPCRQCLFDPPWMKCQTFAFYVENESSRMQSA